MIEIAIVRVTALHTVEDSTLAESSTGNTRLADRLLTEICRFFIAVISFRALVEEFASVGCKSPDIKCTLRTADSQFRQLDGMELNALICKPLYLTAPCLRDLWLVTTKLICLA